MTLFRIRIRHDILWIRLSYRASQLNNLCRAVIKGGGRVDGGVGVGGGGGGGRGVGGRRWGEEVEGEIEEGIRLVTQYTYPS